MTETIQRCHTALPPPQHTRERWEHVILGALIVLNCALAFVLAWEMR